MHKIRQLLLFLDRGFSQRNIEKETGINRRTIAGYLRRFGASGFSFRKLLLFEDSELEVYLNADKPPREQTDPRRSELEALFPYMLSELRKAGVTRLLIRPFLEANRKLWPHVRSDRYVNHRKKACFLKARNGK
ncbi:hypothetical protein SAMN05421747_1294 [Parapedobacter composti]|uniref:Homeodomain-like domain-containing protein n=1 Tax=Parapedobacter composti TaxID=623281 RepID=A0A1I1M4F9_9SPHI|nr:hypothetical protein [Parapedobacter composti]SFC80377.1 hypothetical protein SAMN05421747_1294 [Parapedobacter composti]